MARILVNLFCSFVATSVALGGCGGGGSARTCAKVQPCGGSIVGTWTVTDNCVTASMLTFGATSFCPQAAVTMLNIDIAGTTTYNADLTHFSAISVTQSFKVDFPPECLTQGGITLTCAQFNSGIQSQLLTNPDPSIKSFTCAATGANCDCSVIGNTTPQNDMGTYLTMANTVTSTRAGEIPSTVNYCVQGSTLYLVADSALMSMGLMGTISDVVVLKKQ